MLFFNKLPLTAHCIYWMEQDSPPDDWTWHDPVTGPVDLVMHDDLYQRYMMLVSWLINESVWDQLYRQAQVSHREYQWVTDYLLNLESEMEYEVPRELSPFDFPMPLDYCGWGSRKPESISPDRYPSFIMGRFSHAGLEMNPTSPIDDERHPDYNWYSYFREHRQKYELKQKQSQKVKVVRVKSNRHLNTELPMP